MSITVYIDLSAKIEQWTRDSAIAMANEQQSRVLLVTGSVKQRIRQRIKKLYGPKLVQYRLLAVMVFMVIRESLSSIDYVVIDKDYGGSQTEATIRNVLLTLIRREKEYAPPNMIRFEEIRGSRADRLAREGYTGMRKADYEPNYGEIAHYLKK